MLRGDSVTKEARDVLERMRREAAALRLRVVALLLAAIGGIGGSLVVAFGAFGTAALSAPLLRSIAFGITPAHFVFVIGLAASIAAVVTTARLASANEADGAATRLLGGSVRLRSSRVSASGERCMVDLVFHDGHRAGLLVSAGEAAALAELLAVRADAAGYRTAARE